MVAKPLHRAVEAAKGLIGKKKTPRRELHDWLLAHPEVAEGAEKGFEDIEAGRYRKVSRRQGNV